MGTKQQYVASCFISLPKADISVTEPYLVSLHDYKPRPLCFLLGDLFGLHSLGKLQVSSFKTQLEQACPIAEMSQQHNLKNDQRTLLKGKGFNSAYQDISHACVK